MRFKSQSPQSAPAEETPTTFAVNSQQFASGQPPAGLCSGLKPSSILFLIFSNLNAFPETSKPASLALSLNVNPSC